MCVKEIFQSMSTAFYNPLSELDSLSAFLILKKEKEVYEITLLSVCLPPPPTSLGNSLANTLL
jgi:hypothetical protein